MTDVTLHELKIFGYYAVGYWERGILGLGGGTSVEILLGSKREPYIGEAELFSEHLVTCFVK